MAWAGTNHGGAFTQKVNSNNLISNYYGDNHARHYIATFTASNSDGTYVSSGKVLTNSLNFNYVIKSH